jgi:hypothetical protein
MTIVVRHPFSAFAPENIPMLREYQYNFMGFDSLILHQNSSISNNTKLTQDQFIYSAKGF